MFMGSRGTKIYPRDCIIESFKVLTTSYKIWIPFIILLIISISLSSIKGVLRGIILDDLHEDPTIELFYRFYMMQIGLAALSGILTLLIIPTYMLMFRAIICRKDPSFLRSFKRGLRSFPKLLGASLIVVTIYTIITTLVLNVIVFNFLGNLRAIENELWEESISTNATGIPYVIFGIFFAVFIIQINQSIVLGKRGFFRSFGESFKIGIRHYIPLFALLFFFRILIFLIGYIHRSVVYFYEPPSWYIIPVEYVFIPFFGGVIGALSALTFVSFYLRYRMLKLNKEDHALPSR